jgi:alkylation response protein AidB-like acyl-CoA dehydrogenase
MQADAGVFCPVSMTDALARVLEKYASEPLKRRFLPGLIALNMAELKQGAMFLTEKQGGSDVGQTATVAKARKDCDPLAGEEIGYALNGVWRSDPTGRAGLSDWRTGSRFCADDRDDQPHACLYAADSISAVSAALQV